jgi:hypothetical protein
MGSRLRLRARQAAGKIRRFFRASVYTRENDAMLALRQGECTRCGACCKILFRCPFLIEQPGNPPGEIYSCSIYGSRFNQCRIYPLAARDLLEIEEPCGYTFLTPDTRPQ